MTEKWQLPEWARRRAPRSAADDRQWQRARLRLLGIPAAQIAEMSQTPEQVRQRLARGEEVVIWDGDGNRVGSFLPVFVDGRYVNPPSVVAARLKQASAASKTRAQGAPAPAKKKERKIMTAKKWEPPNWAQPQAQSQRARVSSEELTRLVAEHRASQYRRRGPRGFIGNRVDLPHVRMSGPDIARIVC